MWKVFKDWKTRELSRFEANNIEDSGREHTYIARIWSVDTTGRQTYIMSIPYVFKKDITSLREAFKKSTSSFKITDHKVSFFDGKWII